MLDPVGSYVVRVINWAAVDPWTGSVTFAGPDPAPGPRGDLDAVVRDA